MADGFGWEDIGDARPTMGPSGFGAPGNTPGMVGATPQAAGADLPLIHQRNANRTFSTGAPTTSISDNFAVPKPACSPSSR